ncbi:MAG: prepilin-type N-terminal cleavage/methylation domain-containing protein [Fimbriimonadaceae bacterium]|nr:prepilin-type N-terminal cleavage/methylation domain-containing protein [Fimbriimonadaceae bacterium]
MHRCASGLSLVEMLVVVGIVLLLASAIRLMYVPAKSAAD